MKIGDWNTLLNADAMLSLQEVGKRLTDARQRRGWSRAALAKRAGIDSRTLAHIESGQPNVSIGIFFQVLSLLQLLKGIEEVLKPENDIEGALQQIRKIRQKRRITRKINDDEVNF